MKAGGARGPDGKRREESHANDREDLSRNCSEESKARTQDGAAGRRHDDPTHEAPRPAAAPGDHADTTLSPARTASRGFSTQAR